MKADTLNIIEHAARKAWGEGLKQVRGQFWSINNDHQLVGCCPLGAVCLLTKTREEILDACGATPVIRTGKLAAEVLGVNSDWTYGFWQGYDDIHESLLKFSNQDMQDGYLDGREFYRRLNAS